jgi:hypothetical protein
MPDEVKQPLRKRIEELKGAVWINGKIVKITPKQDGGQRWRVHAGLTYNYIINVPEDVIRGRTASVEDVVRVFASPGRTRNHPYTAVDFEVKIVRD